MIYLTTERQDEQKNRYLYCVVKGNAKINFGKMGIEDCMVYSVPHKDISVVLHKCGENPYESQDEKVVKEWILAHQYIIAEATKKFGTVVPFSFDTIIKGGDKTVENWLAEEYTVLKDKLDKLRDKDEYNVQIFCEREAVLQQIEKNTEIEKLKAQIDSSPKGMARLLTKKLKRRARKEFKSFCNQWGGKFYKKIKDNVDESKSHRKPPKMLPDKWSQKQIILNLSCLVHKDKVKVLGKELGKINAQEQFAVRFTGPWAPFSFVGQPIGEERRVK